MASRRKGRILAFQALYAWGALKSVEQAEKAASMEAAVQRLGDFSWLEEDQRKALGDTADFARLLFFGTVEQIGDVDSAIKKNLQNWDFSRLKAVDLAILRMSVYSLLYRREIPATVVIDEAIDISREFGNDDSYRFINGVLDGIRKSIEGGRD